MADLAIKPCSVAFANMYPSEIFPGPIVDLEGWGVMSRWGVEQPARDAFQFVLDPATEGESLSDQDRHHTENDLARAQNSPDAGRSGLS
jgi:hypothetical protein